MFSQTETSIYIIKTGEKLKPKSRKITSTSKERGKNTEDSQVGLPGCR